MIVKEDIVEAGQIHVIRCYIGNTLFLEKVVPEIPMAGFDVKLQSQGVVEKLLGNEQMSHSTLHFEMTGYDKDTSPRTRYYHLEFVEMTKGTIEAVTQSLQSLRKTIETLDDIIYHSEQEIRRLEKKQKVRLVMCKRTGVIKRCYVGKIEVRVVDGKVPSLLMGVLKGN